jgi:predicted deacylase
MSQITIDTTTAQPCTKTRGTLNICKEPELNPPFIIINGAKPGKTITILAGTHGTEFPGIEAVTRLTDMLDPAIICGTVIAFPVLNIPQFRERTQFTSPIDGLNLNEEFPGNPEGSYTQRLAHKVYTEAVAKSNALIDCHGGDINEDITGFVVASRSGDEKLDRISLEMASCYSTSLVHVFFSETHGMSNSAQRLYNIPCIQPEAGTPYPLREEAVQFHIEGILNVLKYFKVLPGEPVRHHQLVSPRRLKLYSQFNGAWESRVELDDMVKTGQILGVVKDLYGDTVQTLIAPEDGVISMTRCYYSVKKDELLLVLSTLERLIAFCFYNIVTKH